MNKDQVKGAIKDAAGKVQETAGQVTGSREQQAKGVLKQAEGKGQKALGDAKEIAEHLMLIDLGRNDTGRVSQITGNAALSETSGEYEYARTARTPPGISRSRALTDPISAIV